MIKSKILSVLKANKEQGTNLLSALTHHNVYGVTTISFKGGLYTHINNPKSINLTITGKDKDGNKRVINSKSTSILEEWLSDISIHRNDIYLYQNEFKINQTTVTIDTGYLDLDLYANTYPESITQHDKYLFKVDIPKEYTELFKVQNNPDFRVYLQYDQGLRSCIFESFYDEQGNCIYTQTPERVLKSIAKTAKDYLSRSEYAVRNAAYISNTSERQSESTLKQAVKNVEEERKKVGKLLTILEGLNEK